MIEGTKNAAMKPEEVKRKAPEVEEQEYFFSGGLAYEPVTVKAKTREEAEAKWHEIRKEI